MMSNQYIRLIIRFIGCLLFQVLVLNNIQLTGLMNPYYYPLFVLLLPLQMPQWACLLLSFVMGYSVGIFSNSSGLHAFSTVAMAFARPFVITALFPKTETEDVEELSIGKTGLFNFILYAFVLVFIHHLVFFVAEVWSFTQFYLTSIKIVLSSLMSTLLIIVGEYLFLRKTLR